MENYDIVIAGGGIVGLATAYQLMCRDEGKSVCILEKEQELAMHQTGHNSGVLHTGIYYRPGSLKAINCREGKRAMQAFCTAEGIPFEICGKVIVAVDEAEVPRLQVIYERGEANGVRCELIDATRLAQLEPHARGVRAIHVPEAGIINYRAVCQRLADRLRERGAQIRVNCRVLRIESRPHSVRIQTSSAEIEARYLVNCTGLHSDRVTRLSGQTPPAKIVPFRGEYYALKPAAYALCRNLIYPVPDPNFPFLGVHFTRMIDGSVECGPNAVLACAREGYRKRDIHLPDLMESLTYPGFLRLARKYWRTGLGEIWRSISKRAFVRALQRLVPDIRAEHLQPAPAGVRAQAVTPDGAMVDDFLIQRHDRIVNVCNAPSPAATSSLNIGSMIAEQIDLDGPLD